MQIYAIKLHNFLRFGEKDNTWVLDLTTEEKHKMISGEVTMDEIYEDFVKSPYERVQLAKERGLTPLVGIVGSTEGNNEMSNGTGKSSLLEAICYLHYEKTVRQTANTDKVGKSGLSVVTRFGGEYPAGMMESYVEEYFEENGKLYRAKRGRSFSKTQKSSTPIFELELIEKDKVSKKEGHRATESKETLDDINSMEYDLFVNTQMFGQNDAGKFLMGTDSTKKDMIVKLLRQDKLVFNGIDKIRKDKNALLKEEATIKSKMDYIENKFNNKCIEFHVDVSAELKPRLKNLMSQMNKKVDVEEEAHKKINEVIEKLQAKKDQLLGLDSIKEMQRLKDSGLEKKENINKFKSEQDVKISDKKDQKGALSQEVEAGSKKVKSCKEKVSSLEKKNIDLIECISNLKKKEFDKLIEEGKKVKDEIKDLELKKAELETNINKLSKKSGEISFEINSLEKSKDKFVKQLNNAGGDHYICSECETQVDKKHIEDKLAEVNLKLENLNKKLDAHNKSVGKVVSEKKVLVEKINALNIIIENGVKAERDKDKNKAEIKEHEIHVKNNKESILSLEENITEFADRNKKIDEKIKLIDNEILKAENKFNEELKKMEAELDVIRKEYLEYKEKNKDVESKIKLAESKLKDFSEELKVNSEKRGSLTQEIDSFKENIKEYSSLKKEYEENSKKLKRKLILEKIFGLDGIQTRLTARYLPALNLYIKEFLDILSDGQLMVTLNINQRGQIDVDIQGGLSNEYVMASGGEQMIIRIAVDIGLSLLSCKTSSQNPSVIFLDEIFGPLDVNHTDAVFKMIELLEDKFKRVIMITHNYNLYDRMSDILGVSKESGIYGKSKIKGYIR